MARNTVRSPPACQQSAHAQTEKGQGTWLGHSDGRAVEDQPIELQSAYTIVPTDNQ